jgi:hypothetical protein
MRTLFLIAILILVLMLLLPDRSSAQVKVSGTVTAKAGESIPGANLWIKGTFDGGSNDGEGRFGFLTYQKDSLVLVVSAIGFEQVEMQLNQNTEALTIVLRPKVSELNAVTITSGSIDISDRASAVVMKPLDILTTAGAVGDITGALNTLPGTATVANDGRLFVRGGDATETAIFFDGLRVGSAYGTATSNLPTRNRFNPALFKGTFFSTGGYSAEYGDALSSVLVLETIDEPVRNQTDISMMTVGGAVSSTFTGKKQSITADVAYQNLAPYQELVKQDFDWEKAPLAYSGQVVYRHKWGEDGLIKAFVQLSESKLVLWQKQPGDESRGQRTGIFNDFAFGNVSYKKPINDKWLAEGGISGSFNDDQFDIDSNRFQNVENLIHIKQKFTHYFNDAIKLKMGAETFIRSYEENDLVRGFSRGFNDERAAAFAEAEWFVNTKITVRGGLRSGFNFLTGKSMLEPRLAAAYRPYSNGTVSAAVGTFSQVQNPGIITASPDIAEASATHFQLGFQHEQDGRIFRAEAYHKPYAGLAVQSFSPQEQGQQEFNATGTGVAKGFDVFYRDRKSISNTDFWVTYSYVHSRRQFGTFTSQVQPSFAPEHNISVVGKYWIARWKSQPGATLAINSGFTYDNPNLPGEMQSISPGFASLSVNWSYLFRPNLIIHFSCSNVTGRDNIFGNTYAAQPDEQGFYASEPLRQPAPRFVFVGVFWTLSSDKNANQLNNL